MWVAKTLLIALVINHHNFIQRGIIQSLFFSNDFETSLWISIFCSNTFSLCSVYKNSFFHFILFFCRIRYFVMGASCQPFFFFSLQANHVNLYMVKLATWQQRSLFLLPIFIIFLIVVSVILKVWHLYRLIQ